MHLSLRKITKLLTHRSHVAFLQFPTFGSIDKRPPDGPHSQTVAAVLPASEVLEEVTGRMTPTKPLIIILVDYY